MLFQQDSESGDVDEGQKRSIEFVIAGEYSTKPLEFLKEALNQVTLLVGVPIYWPWIADIALGRDGIDSTLRMDVFPDRLRAVCFVAEDSEWFSVYNKRGCKKSPRKTIATATKKEAAAIVL